jgi:hypothetical protein
MFPEWTALKPTTPWGQMTVFYTGMVWRYHSRDYHKVGYSWEWLLATAKDQIVIFPELKDLQPITPLGQLPVLYWDGLEIPQSGDHRKVGYSWGSLLATVKDQRVTFPEWTALKPTTPLGQLPILYWDGLEIPQSGTIAR